MSETFDTQEVRYVGGDMNPVELHGVVLTKGDTIELPKPLADALIDSGEFIPATANYDESKED